MAPINAATGDTNVWVAQRLKEARLSRGWTQVGLAERLGVTQAAVSNWEAAKRTPSLDDLIELSDVLERDVYFFLPAERARQPVATILRAEALRLASDELQQAVDGLLTDADSRELPERTLEIGARHPAYAANELLEKAGIDHPPVPVDVLAGHCGALVILRDLPDALSGLILKIDDGAIIGVNSRHAEVRQRFTLAHELGHHLLAHSEQVHIDVEDSSPPDHDYRFERAANEFAADLLMPRRMLAQAYTQDARTEQLARTFHVSELAMGYRLMNLGLR